ncbi:hypothetical protein WN55_03149 [Dufourea novaeangliae]|uniref:Uncharacterized protein n=1 Tax=Dufourea novaeangliae TaxID=178035 RepID=A0A154PLB0_DUFNO|nr:hypothetical protein WN55_03149 [Dufourea novaeangliae]
MLPLQMYFHAHKFALPPVQFSSCPIYSDYILRAGAHRSERVNQEQLEEHWNYLKLIRVLGLGIETESHQLKAVKWAQSMGNSKRRTQIRPKNMILADW